jgi:hypothetical protein
VWFLIFSVATGIVRDGTVTHGFTTTVVDQDYGDLYHCSFSPDGKQLAYLRFDGKRTELVIYDIREDARRVIREKSTEQFDRLVNAMGEMLPDLFDVEWIPGTKEVVVGMDGFYLERVNTETGKLIGSLLVGDSTHDILAGVHDFKVSPDKTMMVFGQGFYYAFLCSALWIYPFEAFEKTHRVPDRLVPVRGFDWSPSGNRIVFSVRNNREGIECLLATGLYTLNPIDGTVDTVALERLKIPLSERSFIDVLDPSWTSDSTILFRYCDVKPGTFVIRPDGTGERQATLSDCIWSPIAITTQDRKEVQMIKWMPEYLYEIREWDLERKAPEHSVVDSTGKIVTLLDIDMVFAEWLLTKSQNNRYRTAVIDTWSSDSAYAVISVSTDSSSTHYGFIYSNLLLIDFSGRTGSDRK